MPSDDSTSTSTPAKTDTTPKPANTTTTTTTPKITPGWGCTSTRTMKKAIVLPEKKGFAVDDDTVTGCSDKLLEVWPNSNKEPVRSLRFFSGWGGWHEEWPEEKRQPFWDHVKDFAQKNHAKILMATRIQCEPAYDQKHWERTLKFMEFVGKEHVMGVAFGNEMDNEPKCAGAFSSGAFLDDLKKRVKEMDDKGFEDVPLTTVWTMGALADKPFSGKILSFLEGAHKEWGDRWVWTFNPYPLWDKSLHPHSPNECEEKTEGAIAIGYTKAVMSDARKRVTQVTNSSDSKIWVGEAGWSSPAVANNPTQVAIANMCPVWGSKETLFKYYENLMAWDLSLEEGNPVDHLFYFTMRDSAGNGLTEGFGLLDGKCDMETCKIQGPEETFVV